MAVESAILNFDFGTRLKFADYDEDGACTTGGELRAVPGGPHGHRDCV